ncbi:MAG TPA: cysteine--tRNA ligase [Piscirickettsiaceae bacterium]|nr:cysteine--tRNA ligase [Piscirickettsiaceae bacterium]
MSELLIYNSESRQKERFKPIQPGKVGLYVCGVTVYDYCHVGHARVMVVFDTLVRHLRAQGLAVKYVRNITDIDDKIIQRALENGEPINQLTARFIEAMHEDERALNVLPPDEEPRATEYMDDILSMIETLIGKGCAYQADNGDVYFSVRNFPSYGRLSHKQLADLAAGARVDVNAAKRDPLDFVLWKAAKADEPEEVKWAAPFGKGRPGWHIECSAMSTRCLGPHFDIHGGGMDLQFPHHENEIAQSECATGEHFVNYWMHVGFVRMNDEKMSKSLGNFFTIRQVLKAYHPEVLRTFLLSAHYRSPVNYSEDNLNKAKSELHRLYGVLEAVPPTTAAQDTDFEARFNGAMNDDLNTPQAFAVLFELAREANRTQDGSLSALLVQLGQRLGILQQSAEAFFRAQPGSELSDTAIAALIAERNEARKARDFARADAIRDQLKQAGIELLDGPEGTRWRRQ